MLPPLVAFAAVCSSAVPPTASAQERLPTEEKGSMPEFVCTVQLGVITESMPSSTASMAIMAEKAETLFLHMAQGVSGA